MYIPIGPSKKQLYKIIIALLLLCYLIFLGMYKPKAEDMFNYEPSSWYCPHGIFQNNQVLNDKRYYGCSDTSTLTDLRSEITYTGFNNGSYDIAGTFVISISSLSQINIYANNVACFITNYNGNSGINDSYREVFSYYCFNVEVSNGNLKLETNGIGEQTGTPNAKYGFARTWDLTNHFDKSNSTTINNIQNNTQNISDNLNDSTIDSSSANTFTSNSAFQDTNGLDAIIKAPLNFIQSLTSTTCSTINLTIPYINTNVYLPCMSTVYNKALGVQLVNLISLVINGVVLYRYCLKILQIVKDAKNPNKDGLEVLDL